jgi:hypothetical protein
MRKKSGKEMRNLMLAVSLSVLILVLAIIAYFMIDIVVTTDRNIDQDKEKMIRESVRSLSDMGSVMSFTEMSPALFEMFNPKLIDQVFSGNIEVVYEYSTEIALAFFPVDYVGIIIDGELVNYKGRSGLSIDPSQMPTQAPQGDYETIDSLGGREGFFVSVFYPVDLSLLGLQAGDMYINMVVDRTDELAGIESYFNDQRNDLLLRMGIAAAIAVILSLLLTTLGLRYFTRKYVVDPIEELNRMAEEIAEGTYTEDIKVDEGSAFAALQGLLRSGQKVLQRMDDMEDEEQ